MVVPIRDLEERGAAWGLAVSHGAPIGHTSARVVDFEGDSASLVPSLATDLEPLAAALARATQDLSTLLELPSSFGGFTPSLRLQALRMGDGSIYLNPLHARHMAETEIAPSLKGDARAFAVNYATAQKLTDTLFHQLAHSKARHDVATCDEDFIHAYANAIRHAGPLYSETIRNVRDSLELVFAKLNLLMQPYRQGLHHLGLEAKRVGSLEADDLGRGEIERELAEPATRDVVVRAFAEISRSTGKPMASVTAADISEFVEEMYSLKDPQATMEKIREAHAVRAALNDVRTQIAGERRAGLTIPHVMCALQSDALRQAEAQLAPSRGSDQETAAPKAVPSAKDKLASPRPAAPPPQVASPRPAAPNAAPAAKDTSLIHRVNEPPPRPRSMSRLVLKGVLIAGWWAFWIWGLAAIVTPSQGYRDPATTSMSILLWLGVGLWASYGIASNRD